MIRVAIVEDSKTIRESLTQFVQTDPECRCVCTCATAEEALVGIPKHQPEMVLMDIQLPKLSGIECTAQLKKMLPAVQIIMVTVYEDTERISAALRAGACGYLLKRCAPEELVSAIREARMGGAPMSREIARKVIASFQAAAHGRGGGSGGTQAQRTENSGVAGEGPCQQGDCRPAGFEHRARCAGIWKTFTANCTSTPAPKRC